MKTRSKGTEIDDSKGERLQKVLAKAGVASRRASEKLITDGRVAVDGKVVAELGTRVDPMVNRIEIDGSRIRMEEHVYFILNKPTGVVTTLKDPEGRPTISDLIHEIPERVFPLGRLDYDAEGLLILTNDGDLAHQLTHPKFEVSRVYDAKVRGVPTEAELDRIREGIRLEDGLAKALSVEIVGRAKKNTWVRIEVAEGRQHLIKRLFEAIRYPVQRLRRISYGGVDLGDLPLGAFRALTGRDLALLRDNIGGKKVSARSRTGSPRGIRKKFVLESGSKRFGGKEK